MLFTKDEIQALTNIVDVHIVTLIAQMMGRECLTVEDLELLKIAGIKIDQLLINLPPYKQAWLFGRLTALLSDKQAKTITSNDFQKYLKEGQFGHITHIEKEEYSIAQKATYEHIKGLGSKMTNALVQDISQQEMDRILLVRKEREGVLKEEIAEGILNRDSIKKITSNVGNRMGTWNKDWSRIVETECQGINQLGRAQVIADQHGIETRVFKQVFPGACKHCIALYLTGGIGSQPKIFTLSQLIQNGSNVGRKQKDWKAVIGYVHPYCRCELKHIPKDWIWNGEEHRFTPPGMKERKVERRSKIHVTVGDKKFDV